MIEEKIVEVEKKTAWVELKDLIFTDRVQLNTLLLNDSIVGFLNNYGVVYYNGNTLKSNSGALYGLGDFTIGNKPVATPKTLVSVNRREAVIAATANPVQRYTTTGVRPSSFDPGFSEFVPAYLTNISSQAIVQDRYILLPCFRSTSSQYQQYAYLARINRKTIDGAVVLSMDTVKTISFTPVATSFFQYPLFYLGTAENKFFVTYGNDTYRVDTTGNLKGFGAPMYSVSGMFQLNGNLFAVNPNGKLYASTDKGENWNLFANTNNSLWGFLSFQQIDDEVFAYYRDQIWQINLNGSTLSLTELQNEGLERSLITSIAHGGTRVFVTTLFGVYYRDWNLFKTVK